MLRPGDVFVTNDPYRGGSHLPDVTVVTPVFDDAGERLLFFTASRAHHAEIGGIVPGSMPPFLEESGRRRGADPQLQAGRRRALAHRRIGALLTSGPYPTRNVADNLADIAAQVAANQQGARDLARLVERHSLPVVTAYMRHIQAAAERKMRAALARAARRSAPNSPIIWTTARRSPLPSTSAAIRPRSISPAPGRCWPAT